MLSRLWVCAPFKVEPLTDMLNFHLDQAETVSRRVEKFAELMQSVWTTRNDYEERMRKVCQQVPRGFVVDADLLWSFLQL